MDLGTIKTRIDNGYYTAKDDLIADIQLVWNNAKKFNPIGHFVHDGALFLEQFAHGRIGELRFLSNSTLNPQKFSKCEVKVAQCRILAILREINFGRF